MKIASIDIGTNTVLLLVAQFDSKGQITTLVSEQRIPRLGKGVDTERNLRPESIHQVLSVLIEYKSLIAKFAVDHVVVFGTSAVRDAKNRETFRELIGAETGFELEVISGEDEALWTFRGATSEIGAHAKTTVIDIGGGSTELTSGTDQKIEHKLSIDCGSVRLTEKYFVNETPDESEIAEATQEIHRRIERIDKKRFSTATIIGVAGTATSLAILDQRLPFFSLGAVAGYRISKKSVRGLFDKLRHLSHRQILTLSAVMEGRSDIITAGTLILLELMEWLGCDDLIVSDRGVRYGIAIREWEQRSR